MLLRGSEAAARAPWDVLQRGAAPDLLATDEVSRRLLERLDARTVAQVKALLEPQEAAMLAAAPPQDRVTVMLAYGVHHRVPALLEATGLSAAVPPADVHAMARGPLAAGGGYYYANLIADALRGAGTGLEAVRSGLDFGCSSGRAVRVLAAAYPGTRWHGCDPNAAAIRWAGANLPGVAFGTSSQEPPLHYAGGAFDLVFAISIWSHYGAGAAVRWLEEAGRVIQPGGYLLLTTHGWHSVAHFGRTGARPRAQLEEIAAALYADGFWFAGDFGPAGDHGVVDAEWGTAFMTAEWLVARACPAWRVSCFAPGRVEGNQDLFLLQRA